MKIIVIGAGISGLTAALACAQAGHEVEIYEQNDRLGGVTHTLAEDGYRWDLGQLLIEGMAPHEPVGRVLSELGVSPLISIQKDDRGYVFPDFELRKPEQPEGVHWRLDRLREIFPDKSAGLNRYWRDYIRFTRIMTAGRNLETSLGLKKLLWQARLYWNLLPLLPKKDWSAQRLMDSFFKPIELQCVFMSILADFFTSPRQFMGLGVYALNPEPVYDCRLPSKLASGADQLFHYSIHGGIGKLTEAFANRIQACGGKIFTGRAVVKILVTNNKVLGVVDDQGVQSMADVVIASGGAHETFINMVGSENLSPQFAIDMKRMTLMDSIFMIHLGVDYDPRPQCHGSCTYFYGNYDLDEAIENIRQGNFHEGRDGYVIHMPSNHTPSMAPEGRHALTIYTIAPDPLKQGSWKDEKEEIADRFLACVEERLPGLRQHICKRIILTPDDFRQIAYTDHHAFGGVAPVLGSWRPPHQTPVNGLWFVGAQSESGGGVNNVIIGAYKTARRILRH